MTRKFNIGDRVRLIGGSLKGEEATVLEGLREHMLVRLRGGDCRARRALAHAVDTPCFEGRFYARPENMRLIDDGWEKTSWETSTWKPDHMKEVS